MSEPSKDPSVFDEPHMRGETFRADKSEARADRALAGRQAGEDERIDQSVWDEPGVDGGLVQRPEGAPDYATWIERKRAETPAGRTWVFTFALAAVAGPWAVLGAFYGGLQGGAGVLSMVIIGPLVEETMKVAAALYVVERRPWLFRSRAQIAVCALAAGLAFAVIENALYLSVYIREPSPAIITWRWTVCVGLHMGCALVAGLGLMRIWRDVWARRARPRLPLAMPYLFAAVAVHGVYNALAIAFQMFVF